MEQMKKENFPFIIIIASFLLIALNVIFTSDKMDLGFLLRILSSGLLIIASFLTIRHRKRQREDKSDRKT